MVFWLVRVKAGWFPLFLFTKLMYIGDMKIKGLSVIAALCLILVFLIDFTEIRLPELIIGKGAKFQLLVYTLSISYLASYIFYYLNVYLKESQERKSIMPLVAGNVKSILTNNITIIGALKSKYIFSLEGELPSRNEIAGLLKNIIASDNPPIYYKDKTWAHLFQERRKGTINSIDKIFMSGSHVDDGLRAILLKMRSSLFLREGHSFNSNIFDIETLDDYYLVFYKYFLLIRELEVYYNENLKRYYDREK